MDPMKPASNEPNHIEMPSLKETLQKDIQVLDEFFTSEGDKDLTTARLSWGNVRESAISFADIFDNMKYLQFDTGGDSGQQHNHDGA